MANLQGAYGFAPVRYLNGASWNGAVNMYCIPATDTNMVSPGDAIMSVAGADALGIPFVTKALGTSTVRGVVVGVLATIPNNASIQGTTLDLAAQNIPSTKSRAYYVLVADDPKIVFKLKDDGVTGLTSAAVGKNATFTVANPTAPQQDSASSLNTASPATTASLNLKILGLAQDGKTTFGAYADWLVMFNQHELNGNTTGV